MPDASTLTPAESALLAAAAKLASRLSLVTTRNLASETGLSYNHADRLRRQLRARGLWPYPIPTVSDFNLERGRRPEDEDDPKAGIPSDAEVRAAIAAVRAGWPEWRVEYERRKLYPPVEIRRGKVGGGGR